MTITSLLYWNDLDLIKTCGCPSKQITPLFALLELTLLAIAILAVAEVAPFTAISQEGVISLFSFGGLFFLSDCIQALATHRTVANDRQWDEQFNRMGIQITENEGRHFVSWDNFDFPLLSFKEMGAARQKVSGDRGFFYTDKDNDFTPRNICYCTRNQLEKRFFCKGNLLFKKENIVTVLADLGLRS